MLLSWDDLQSRCNDFHVPAGGNAPQYRGKITGRSMRAGLSKIAKALMAFCVGQIHRRRFGESSGDVCRSSGGRVKLSRRKGRDFLNYVDRLPRHESFQIGLDSFQSALLRL